MLVVRDTRASGEMLEAALCAGIAAEGGQALLGGVLPTPAASILARRYGFDLARRHLGVAQPVPGQRHQVLRRRGQQALRRGRGRRRAPRARGRERRRPAAGARPTDGCGP